MNLIPLINPKKERVYIFSETAIISLYLTKVLRVKNMIIITEAGIRK